MLNEAEIIKRLKAEFPDYIGDDAAVIRGIDGHHHVISTDLLLENIHFRTRYVDPASLAHKALHVNLSDIAAMGAKPQFVMLGIAIPATHEDYASQFLQHFTIACKNASVILIGGDTTKSPDKLFISITLIGTATTDNIRYRHTAQPDDVVCVAGHLGYAHVGLLSLEKSLDNLNQFKMALLKPTARIKEGIWLAKQPEVHAMMDVSDGLYVDLKRLCAASNVAATVNLDQLRPLEEFISACNQLNINPIETILTGGEDYSLLFTVNPLNYQTLADKFHTNFGYDLKCFGTITPGSNVSFSENGVNKDLHLTPFSHFGESL